MQNKTKPVLQNCVQVNNCLLNPEYIVISALNNTDPFAFIYSIHTLIKIGLFVFGSFGIAALRKVHIPMKLKHNFCTFFN